MRQLALNKSWNPLCLLAVGVSARGEVVAGRASLLAHRLHEGLVLLVQVGRNQVLQALDEHGVVEAVAPGRETIRQARRGF